MMYIYDLSEMKAYICVLTNILVVVKKANKYVPVSVSLPLSECLNKYYRNAL